MIPFIRIRAITTVGVDADAAVQTRTIEARMRNYNIDVLHISPLEQ